MKEKRYGVTKKKGHKGEEKARPRNSTETQCLKF